MAEGELVAAGAVEAGAEVLGGADVDAEGLGVDEFGRLGE